MNKYLIKVTDRIIDFTGSEWAMNIENFDWVPGVGLYGIYMAYKSTGIKKYIDYLISWTDRHLSEAYKCKTVNSAAPLLTVIELYNETKDPEYLRVCIDICEYILNYAPRTIDGGLEHTVTENVHRFSDQIWADTLFMVCIFVSKMGAVTGKTMYADFAAEQLEIHHRLLSDGRGLYYHGYNGEMKNHMSAVKWGRANAWILYSTVEILKTLPNIKCREKFICKVKDHVKALSELQRMDGGFGTILDDCRSYTEISATAGIAAGIKLAVDCGFISEKYEIMYRNAIDCIKHAISYDGTVRGVSSGTPVMSDAAAYKNIPLCPTLYGQGLAAAALVFDNANIS